MSAGHAQKDEVDHLFEVAQATPERLCHFNPSLGQLNHVNDERYTERSRIRARLQHAALISGFLLTISVVSMAILDASDLSVERAADGTALGHLLGSLIVYGGVGGLAYVIFRRSLIAFYVGALVACIASIIPELEYAPASVNSRSSQTNSKDAQIDDWVSSEGLDSVMAAVVAEGQKNLPLRLNDLDRITTIAYLPSRDLQIYKHVVPLNWREALPEKRSVADSERENAFLESLRQYALNAACTNSTLKVLLLHGLRISHVYHDAAGNELMQVTIAEDQCGVP